MTVCGRCIFVSSGCVLIFLLCYQQRKFFSQKRILKNYFSSRHQKTKKKNFFFLKKRKIKQFRLISKKEIIFFNYSRVFEEAVYYALYCPLKSYLALKLAIWRRGSRCITCTYIYLLKIIFSNTWPWNWHIGLLKMASLFSQIVAEIDYSVKMISERRTTSLLLFVFVENRIFFHFWPRNWHFHDLELKLPLQMTLKMTLNHKNNTINGFFHSKSHEKEVLHMLLALFVQKWYFHSLDHVDPKIDLLTLKMTLNNPINFRNGRSFSVIFVRHKSY